METQITHYYGNKHDLKEVFISALKETGLIVPACQKAGISTSTFYRWRDDESDNGDFYVKYLEVLIDVVLRLGDKLKQVPKQKLSFEIEQLLAN